MTPQEKAKDLISIYSILTPDIILAKNCARLAAQTALHTVWDFFTDRKEADFAQKYWMDTIKEIGED